MKPQVSTTASQTRIFVGMEEGYIVAAVEVDKALRFYTARAGQQAVCERELAQQGLQLLVWGRGQTEEDAMTQAMQQAALVITLRSMEE